MMRRRLFGVFNSIDEAKNTLGQIKKESWNQTEIMVIVREPDGNREIETEGHYEMAGENFLSDPSPETGRRIDRLWPGFKEMELAGIGSVNIGYSTPVEGNNEPAIVQQLNEKNIQVVEREISGHKVVALIEAEEQFLPKLRFIMDANGAELLEQDF
jgi:hypothetical protein